MVIIKQIELEHRSPKSRYLRTNRKNFEKQMGNIERRQSRIRKIRQKLDNSNRNHEVSSDEKTSKLVSSDEKKPKSASSDDKKPKSGASDYHIGKTQNRPLNLRVFADERCYDPAAKVCQLMPSVP